MLSYKNLWMVVDGTEPCPMSPVTTEEQLFTDSKQAQAHDVQDWITKDQAAKGIIRNRCKVTQWHVMDCVMAKDMWETLQRFHLENLMDIDIHYCFELFTCKYVEDTAMAYHIMALWDLQHRMMASGKSSSLLMHLHFYYQRPQDGKWWRYSYSAWNHWWPMASVRCSKWKQIGMHARSPVAQQPFRWWEEGNTAEMLRTVILEEDNWILARDMVHSLMMSANIAKGRDIGPINVCDKREMKKGRTYTMDWPTLLLATCRIWEHTRLAAYFLLWPSHPSHVWWPSKHFWLWQHMRIGQFTRSMSLGHI